MSSLVVRETWFTRLLRAVGLVTPTEEDDFEAGADYASDFPATRSYPATTSMSAYAAFPWVYACADAIASNLSMLPIKAVRGVGADSEPVDDHPILDLLRSPSSRVDGTLFRRQAVIDLILTGDAYALIIGEREPSGLIRMHPARTKVVPLEDGQPGHYEYSGAGRDSAYAWSQVVHIRSPSWEDSPASLYGQGAIRALNEDLLTDQAAAKLAANAAKTGRPSAIISPSEDGDRWSAEQIAQIRAAYQKQLAGTSGALFMGGPAKYESLGFSPRDMEYQAVRNYARESTLAAFGVPPTLVGLPTANYATARQQAKTFWESLQGRAAAIDAELTRLARRYPRSETIRVMHDFSNVEALQESSTERVNRVQLWWMMGIPLADAAAYEGFDDLPVGGGAPASEPASISTQNEGLHLAVDFLTRRAPSAVDSAHFSPDYASDLKETDASIWALGEFGPQASALGEMVAREGGLMARNAAEEALLVARTEWASSNDRGVGLVDVVNQIQWLVIGRLGAEYQRDVIDRARQKVASYAVAVGGDPFERPDLEIASVELRDVYWRVWLKNVQAPFERSMTLAVRRYALGAADRLAKRIPQAVETSPERSAGVPSVVRQLTDLQIEKLLAHAEETALFDAVVRGIYVDMVARGYRDAAKRIGIDLAAPGIQQTLVRQMVETLTHYWNDTTKEYVLRAVEDGIAQGLTTSQMQTAILQNKAYNPARARMVARTETTRALNAAASASWDQAVLQGINLEVEWITARDDEVRETHRELDGARVKPGVQFINSQGHGAFCPGQFGLAAEDINCRCVALESVIR